jgi:hypothetical protein
MFHLPGSKLRPRDAQIQQGSPPPLHRAGTVNE